MILNGMEASEVPRADIQRPLEESAPLPHDTSVTLRPSIPRVGAAARGRGRHARPTWSRRTARRLVAARRRVAGWADRPSGRFALPGVFIAALVASALTAGGLLVPAGLAADPAGHTATLGGPSAGAPATAIGDPATAWPSEPGGIEPPPSLPPATTAAPTATGLPADALLNWAQQTSIRTGVPVVALQAYGYAELVLAQTRPGCRLRWTTLAAIGRVESNHGRAGAARLLDDGRALPPIIGDPLDGRGGRARIMDTDGGRLDGDPVYDRAVGPMQFIPTTWEEVAIDASGDGVADIHNIHDAALAAAEYLCQAGRDLGTAEDWWAAILSYNNVRSYAEEVFSAANEYGRQSRT